MFDPVFRLVPGLKHISADSGQQEMSQAAFELAVEEFFVYFKIRKAVIEVGGSVGVLIQR